MTGNKVLPVGALRCLTASGAGKVANRQAWRQRVREIELEYRVDDLEALLVALETQGIELSVPRWLRQSLELVPGPVREADDPVTH